MRITGVMIGSSCDGIDLACIEFTEKGYVFLAHESLPLPSIWKSRLQNVYFQTADILIDTHAFFGHYIGEQVEAFHLDFQLENVDYVAVHGFTVFHSPKKRFSFQIGDGTIIAKISGCKVLTDFRTGDMVFGGQGAPLAPMLDRRLFSEYTACVNLGGIANIAYGSSSEPKGYDICPCNTLLNFLSRRLGKDFDANGELASKGNIDELLLTELESQTFYTKKPPRSIDTRYIEEHFFPHLEDHEQPVQALHTVSFHIAKRIARSIQKVCPAGTVLLSGGGALNTHLVQSIQGLLPDYTIQIASKQLLECKESLLMAYLGKLYAEGEFTALPSLTGASRPSINGVLHLP